MHCGGCFIVRFIDALSADLFENSALKRTIKTGLSNNKIRYVHPETRYALIGIIVVVRAVPTHKQ